MNRKTPIEYAFYLLQLRDRSVGEIREKMRRKNFSDAEIESVVTVLKEKKFLDDEKFIQNYIEYQLRLKPQGKYQLKMKLRQLHLEEDLIEKALGKIEPKNELCLAIASAEKWLARRETLLPEVKRDKLIRHLASRGFGWEIIKTAIAKLLNC